VGGSETGNPAVPTSLALSVRSSDPTTIAVRGGAKITVIEHAWVAFGEIRFLSGDECKLLESFPHEKPTQLAADLAAPNVRWALDVREGDYCGAVATLENSTAKLPQGAPEQLADHSIVLTGHLADGTAFTLAYPQADELELQAISTKKPIEVSTDGPLHLLAFDVAEWLAGVDLASAQRATDGSILIDEQHNLSKLEQFEQNLDCSLSLYADTNDDGVLDDADPLLARCPKS
jgi:hypothetical protein